jgi:hypothetical protein
VEQYDKQLIIILLRLLVIHNRNNQNINVPAAVYLAATMNASSCPYKLIAFPSFSSTITTSRSADGHVATLSSKQSKRRKAM